MNLKLNLEKCNFVKTEVKVLGHLVSKQGIQTDPKKVESIQKLEIPKDVTEVKSFLGVRTNLESLFPSVQIWPSPCF